MYRGDYKKALSSITAKAYVMRGMTDPYFPPEDSELEVANMPYAEFVPIKSIWGYFAGGPGLNSEDVAFIDAKLKDLLASGKLIRETCHERVVEK
jgi:homoserine O-acetyltransferase